MKFTALLTFLAIALSISTFTEVEADCIGGFSQVTVLSTAEGMSTTFENPSPPNNQMSVFTGLINCEMDGNPSKVYCIDLFQTVGLPDTTYAENCEYAVARAQYVLNTYYPLNAVYPGKLSNNQEAAAIQLVMWSLYNNININTVTDSVIKNRALAIRADADLNGMVTPAIITFTINPGVNPDDFYVRTIDQNGDPIAVSGIVLSGTGGAMLGAYLTATDASGNSPDIEVTGASNASVITAVATMPYAQGRVIDGAISDRQTLTIALPVWGKMGVQTDWGALPVELSSFSSVIHGNKVELIWSTSSEINNSHFEIERIGEAEWVKVGSVTGNGNSLTSHQYRYSEAGLLPGNYRYRLKQVDYNGNFEYFNLTNEIIIGLPDKYSLSQNYPNPFNPTTNINFSISADANVLLNIFDISGKQVMTVLNEHKSAGQYSVQVNGGNLSSGIYYYKIKAGDFTAIKKMTLIK